MQVNLPLVILIYRSNISLFHSLQEQFPTKKWKRQRRRYWKHLEKVEVNIPLLDAIKQIPRYAKFLKELCTNKRKLKGSERISMGKNVSALIGKSVPQIPEKCKDPGTFSIPCIIGNSKFDNAMLDLVMQAPLELVGLGSS